jgi:adenylate cyclase
VTNLTVGRPLDHGTGPQAMSLAAILLLGALAFATTQLLPPIAMTAASLALLAGWAAAAQLAFGRGGLWLDIVFPSAAVLAAAGVGFVGRILAERGLRRDVERQRGNLLRYHSPLIAQLLAESDAPITAGKEQPATILFVDMAGFTKRVEVLAPAETARFLREFHRRIETAALAEGGVLEQFTGDGAMVVFGLPTPGPADAAAAVACARRLLHAVEEWNAALAGRNEPPLEIRIGVHCGPVALATLGGEAQRQMTVAGDTVNVASRLEALARQHDAVVVISDAVATAVRAADRASLLDRFEALPPQPIRGRAQPLAVWVLRAAAPTPVGR